MASTTTRFSFTFNFSTTTTTTTTTKPTSSKPKPNFPFIKSHPISPLKIRHRKLHLPPRNSIDVSKEDNPTSNQQQSPEPDRDPDNESFVIRRMEEKFAVLNTGIHECRSCGYLYDEGKGDPSYPIPPGLPFDKLPDDWRCATCGASKSFFQSKSVEIAGFAQNQQFGLGGNTLTSGQKAVLIYGGLLLGFVFFLSGYFLQ